MINGLFLGRSNRNKFERSEIFEFSNDRLDKFQAYIDDLVRRIRTKMEIYFNTYEGQDGEDIFLSNFACCETKFGLCGFTPLCTANSADDRESIVNMDYVRKVYDPLQFQL